MATKKKPNKHHHKPKSHIHRAHEKQPKAAPTPEPVATAKSSAKSINTGTWLATGLFVVGVIIGMLALRSLLTVNDPPVDTDLDYPVFYTNHGLPVYPNAQLLQVSNPYATAQQGVNFVSNTESAPVDVAIFFEKELAARGWQVQKASNRDEADFIYRHFTKDTQRFTLNIVRTNQLTRVHISYVGN